MFGVEIHFSIKDLLALRGMALPGAIGQIAVAIALAFGVTRWWGWPVGEGLVFGLALSVASTVVLLRAVAASGDLERPSGRTAVGWLIVEDLVVVLTLVFLPAWPGRWAAARAVPTGISSARLPSRSGRSRCSSH